MKIYILGTTELYFKSLGKQMSNTILFKKKNSKNIHMCVMNWLNPLAGIQFDFVNIIIQNGMVNIKKKSTNLINWFNLNKVCYVKF